MKKSLIFPIKEVIITRNDFYFNIYSDILLLQLKATRTYSREKHMLEFQREYIQEFKR